MEAVRAAIIGCGKIAEKHVNALAERVPVRFEVRKDVRSARVERVGL